MPRLSRAELEQVQRLLDIGGISDLMDWARAVQARDPAFADFSQQVQRLARLGDLAAIGKLCERMPVA
jgi:N-acetylglucosamine kinase-like BadF-type ATPase